jgi:putative IMPACT (imprinted ancient) family translation regulator
MLRTATRLRAPPRLRAAAATYTTLAAPVSATLEIKKSKFAATAWPAASPDEAAALIAAASDPSASHNVWAWRAAGSERCSDDGEPAGTAGRPVLAALAGLDRVAVLVVRHFGGVKLGVGGLARAYGQAARESVKSGVLVEVEPAARVSLNAPLDDAGALWRALGAVGASGVAEAHDGARVELTAMVDARAAAGLAAAVASATAGRARVEIVGEGV